MNVTLRSLLLDGVRADLLRDAAGFAGRNVGLANLVEQRRLAVVDVTEYRHDRRTRRHHFGLVFFLLDGDFFAGFFDDRIESELLGDGNGNVARNVLVDRRHRAHLDQLGDDVFDRNDHRRREFLNGQQVGNFDRFERARRRDRRDVIAPFSCDAALCRAAALFRGPFSQPPYPRASGRGRRDVRREGRRRRPRASLRRAGRGPPAGAVPAGPIGRNGPLPAGRGRLRPAPARQPPDDAAGDADFAALPGSA